MARTLNVVFVIVDDLRPELGCYGAGEVVSPNFDRLASKGMICHHAYAQYPVCNPSRASFLSGLRPEECGVISNTVPFRAELPDIVSLPQHFRQNGYFTAGIGKIFHLGQDPEGRQVLFQDPLSWDYFFDSLHDAPRIGRTGEGRNLTADRLKWCAWRAANGDDEDQPDGINTSTALRILEEHHEEPFFLALGLHKPHDPFIAPKKYFDLYPTFIDYAGLEAPHQLPGTSLRPVFDDSDHPGKDAAFSQVNRGQAIGRSVRNKRWRYTEWGPEGQAGTELYDHETDPGEYYNLADDSGHAAIRQRMAERLKQGFPSAR